MERGIPKSLSGYVKRSLSYLISREIQRVLEGQRKTLLGGVGEGMGGVEVGKHDCLVMYKQACDAILVGLEGFLKIEKGEEQKRLM